MSAETNKQNNKKIGWAFLASIALLSVCAYLPFMQRLDFLWLDTLARWRAVQQPAPNDIVLIDIDTYSIEAMAPEVGAWPWPRATHAYLLDWLNEQGVKAIVFDVWFSEASLYLKEMDSYFTETLATYNNVYMPTLLYEGEIHTIQSLAKRSQANPFIVATDGAQTSAKADILWPALGDAKDWRLGVINFLSEHDGIGRQYYVYMEKYGWRFLSLPAVVARDFGYPLPQTASLRLDWLGQRPPIKTHSYHDIFQHVKNGDMSPELKDKFVFIGSTASGNHDLKPTVLGAQFPAVYMMMNAFDNLRTGKSLSWSPMHTLFAGAPLLLIMLWVMVSEHSYLRVVFSAIGSVAILVAISLWSVQSAYLVPIISPFIIMAIFLFSCAIIRYLQARDAQINAIELFGRFLDKNVVKQLVDSGLTQTSQLAQERTITVLFSDIRGFTTLSEKHDAATIMQLLNNYFSTQVSVIFRHQGTLDKFIGDAIMAFWGAPLDDSKHAENAIKAALDMAQALDKFCQDHKLDNFDIGIGIHTGTAVVGMLGAQQRMDYTAIGDTVNLASRLEGLTKGIARILVSKATRDSCLDSFDFIAHGAYKVKGREEEVLVFEPRSKRQ